MEHSGIHEGHDGWEIFSSIEGGIGHKTVFVAVFARKKTEDHYPL